jgi:DNA-binding beta-propeller fold protein YncE
MKIKKTFNLKRFTYLTAGLMALMTVSVSCEEEDLTDEGNNENPEDLAGIYISNEGNFGSSDASISFINPESYEVTNKVFQNANGRELGDILQDIYFTDNQNAYLVVNNSKKVEVVDSETFESIGVLTGVDYPRQFEQVSPDKGYLTNGNSATGEAGKVYIINLIKNEITDSIMVGEGPESMAVGEDYVYVANSGGYNQDSTVFVIDKNMHQTVDTIEVGNIPFDIEIDNQGDIWVFCKGLGSWQTGGPTTSKLVKINQNDFSTTFYDIGKTGSFGYYLLATDKNKENIYYVGADGVYKMGISDNQVPASPVINKVPYGIDVNPDNNEIFLTVSNYSSKGFVFRYDTNYSIIDSTEVGYNPNAVVFN